MPIGDSATKTWDSATVTLSRLICVNCSGGYVSLPYQAVDLKTLKINFYCSIECMLRAIHKGVVTLGVTA